MKSKNPTLFTLLKVGVKVTMSNGYSFHKSNQTLVCTTPLGIVDAVLPFKKENLEMAFKIYKSFCQGIKKSEKKIIV